MTAKAGRYFREKLADAGITIAAPSTAIVNLSAITGGESPTEAEHNAIRATVNEVLAALRVQGLIST